MNPPAGHIRGNRHRLTHSASGPVLIPDNDPVGASLNLTVVDSFPIAGLDVSVMITHTWRGDLQVKLLKDGILVKVLHDRSGGSGQNLVETFHLSPAELGGISSAGTWTLGVVDTAAEDAGTIDQFVLRFLVS